MGRHGDNESGRDSAGGSEADNDHASFLYFATAAATRSAASCSSCWGARPIFSSSEYSTAAVLRDSRAAFFEGFVRRCGPTATMAPPGPEAVSTLRPERWCATCTIYNSKMARTLSIVSSRMTRLLAVLSTKLTAAASLAAENNRRLRPGWVRGPYPRA